MAIQFITRHFDYFTYEPTPSKVSSEDSSDLLERLKKIQTRLFFQSDNTLSYDLEATPPENLKLILEQCLIDELEKDTSLDLVALLDRLSALISLPKLKKAFEKETANTLQETQEMLDEAKFYLQMTKEPSTFSLQNTLNSLIEALFSVVESLVSAFGVGEFFKAPKSDLDSDMKAGKIMMLISLFAMLKDIILPLFEASEGATTLGLIFLSIASLSIAWPFIKPKTTYLPAHAENWTNEVRSSNHLIEGRKESLDAIFDILKMKRHAILVGPSRVGKSLTAKAFSQALERGVYPELKGKTVFRINTADIIGQTSSLFEGGNDMLQKISQVMGRHRSDIILVLDEVHMACKNHEKIADQLKLFLDEGGEFPHVIGITTDKEYEEHVKSNDAFSLRFDKVDIKNTSKEETIKILATHMLKTRNRPFIEEGALEYIYTKSLEDSVPQPASSLKLLKRCLDQTQKTQTSDTQKKLRDLESEILLLRSQIAIGSVSKHELRSKIALLQKEEQEIKQIAAQETLEIDKLFKARDLLDRTTKEMYLSILELEGSSPEEKHLKRLLLLQDFFSKTLTSYIEKKAEATGYKSSIDKALIDAVSERSR